MLAQTEKLIFGVLKIIGCCGELLPADSEELGEPVCVCQNPGLSHGAGQAQLESVAAIGTDEFLLQLDWTPIIGVSEDDPWRLDRGAAELRNHLVEIGCPAFDHARTAECEPNVIE